MIPRGHNRIETIFSRLRKAGSKAFIPYIMAGDGGLERTAERVLMLQECGADIIELGVPFSDPLADGPTIQRAAERALAAGISLRKLLPLVTELRRLTQIPIVLMTYYNPVYRYGVPDFVDAAADAEIDGLIIPDLPPEEAGELIRRARQRGLATVFLVAPTSTDTRMRRIVAASTGFVYYVTITGITGSGLTLHNTFASHVHKLKGMTSKPIAAGFGVSSPDDARRVSAIADGVIIGSAIVKQFQEAPAGARDFIRGLRDAII